MRHSRQRPAAESPPPSSWGPRLSQRIDPLAGRRGRLPMPRMLRLALVLLIAMAGLGVVLAMVALVVSAGTATVRSAASAKALRPAAASQHGGWAPGPSAPLSGEGGTRQPGPSAEPSYPAGSHRRAVRRRTTGRRAASRSRPGRRIASFSASGSIRTAGFTIPRTGLWGLTWRYSCPVGLRPTFVISEADTSLAHTLDVSESLPRGRGLRWIAHDAGRHRLLVVSDCTWTVGVVLPAR
ncbi:MAG: hypothetical protein M0030_10750 [Actinomycetota bacterium]|nr:hypothetical protein [Actinomycetota bacterium]